jgi:PEGA domain-containing protein
MRKMTSDPRPRFVHIAGVVSLVALVAATRPARAGESGEAEALIRQGVELRSQKKDERALPLFEKAYQLSRSPRTAGQLGLVEMALGYFVDAEKYLSEAVASPDHPWVAKNLPTLKAQLATAKTQIGELFIVGEPAGAEVWVNGKQVGKLPLAAAIRLDKGRADVQVRAPGYVSSSDSVVMVGGKREDRSYRLQREAVAVVPPPPVATPKPVAPPPAAQPAKETPKPIETKPSPSVAVATPPPAASPASPSPSPSASITATPAPANQGGEPGSLRPYAWGVGIAAGVGLVLGAVEGIVAIKKKNEFNDHMTNGIYDCNTTTLTSDCEGIMKSHDSARTLSIVGFVAGGVLGAGAAVLWILSSPKEKGSGSSTAFACAPDVGTRGVACRLQF